MVIGHKLLQHKLWTNDVFIICVASAHGCAHGKRTICRCLIETPIKLHFNLNMAHILRIPTLSGYHTVLFILVSKYELTNLAFLQLLKNVFTCAWQLSVMSSFYASSSMHTIYTLSRKNGTALLLSITSLNASRFSNFFHHRTHR